MSADDLPDVPSPDPPQAPASTTAGPSAAATPSPVHGFWWIRLALGIVAVVVGLLALAWPDATVTVVAVLFGLYLLVEGVLRVLQAVLTPAAGGLARMCYALLGVISVVVGVLCLRNLMQTVAVLTVLLGLFWLIAGILELLVTLSAGPPGRWTARTGLDLLVAGVAVLAGIVVLAYPSVSLTALAVLLGLSLIGYGVASVVDGVRLRGTPST